MAGSDYTFDFFQVPHIGVDYIAITRDCDDHVRDDVSTTHPSLRRHRNMTMSNFGAYFVDNRSSDDYTKTQMTYKFKDDIGDVSVVKPEWQYAERNENPLVAGSTVKYTRDDKFIIMSMHGWDSDAAAQITIPFPAFDVMDTKEATAAGINATSNANMKNWPSEGWRSFGGKYDFLPYAGGVLK